METPTRSIKIVLGAAICSWVCMVSYLLTPLLLGWCLLVAPTPSRGADLSITEPLDYQVVQRSTATRGTLRIRAKLLDADEWLSAEKPPPFSIEARLAGESETLPWSPVDGSVDRGILKGNIEAPAGGWWRLEVRIANAGKELARGSVPHVGIGDVFVVAGQSNSANHGEEKQQTKSGRVSAFDRQAWRIADDPQPGASGQIGSFIPPFADAVVAAHNVPVGIIACGIGATSVREWLPKGTSFPNPPTLESRVERLPSGLWASKGDAYENLVSRMKSLGPRGFLAVLWHQGESDANQKDPTRTLPGDLYSAYLEKIIRDSRRDIGWDAPWFVAQASYHVPGDEGSEDIRAAQASLWKTGVALEGPDSDAIRGKFRERDGQGVHFSGKGLREHGSRWAEKVLPWLQAHWAAGNQPKSLSDASKDRRPNIIVILADDLGWRDLRCTGNPWHDTPHLDLLAEQGTRFTQAYAPAPICSASRAGLLTGRSPARLGFEFVVKDAGVPQSKMPLVPPPYPRELALSETTIAEILGNAGYVTGFFGKWHLNQHGGEYLSWSDTHGPLQQGFVEGHSDFGSHPYGDKTGEDRKKQLPPGDYGQDTLTEAAVAFLQKHRSGPFYLQLSHYYVHDPFRTQAPWLVEKYRGKLPAGTESRRAVYGAMVETLDHFVGRILDSVDALGLAEDTLVVFTSDNGGHPQVSANGPLRGSKWNLYEGGLRVPWIVRWPGRVAAGNVSDEPFTGLDLLPTLCRAAGAPLPTELELDGSDVLPIWTGEAKGLPERAFLFHFPYYHPEGSAFAKAIPEIGTDDFAISQTRPHSALRLGRWKLVHFFENNEDELYDLKKDPGETLNLASREPDRLRTLRARLDKELAASSARLPILSPRP